MKKFYTMMAIAALCMPAAADTFDQDAVALTNCIVTAGETDRPTDRNWLVGMYVDGGYKFTKVQTVDGKKSFVQHGSFVKYDETKKEDTDLATNNSKLNQVFTKKYCNGYKFPNIPMNNGIGEVTVPTEIYIDGAKVENGAKGGDVVFRYGFGTDLRLGLKVSEINKKAVDLNKFDGFEVGLELPNNNEVEITFTTSLYDLADGLGKIGHVAYYQMGNHTSASSSNPKKLKLTNVGELQGDKDFMSFVAADKVDSWIHLPIKWLDIIVKGVKPGETVGIYSLKSFEKAEGSSVATIEADDVDAPVEFFNMQGVRVANPENGIYIKRQGNKVSKVVVK